VLGLLALEGQVKHVGFCNAAYKEMTHAHASTQLSLFVFWLSLSVFSFWCEKSQQTRWCTWWPPQIIGASTTLRY